MIFASKHVSEAQRPAITVQATGNLTKQAEFGGRPEEVSYVEPFRLKIALRRLKEEAAKARVQIEVTMEATHHGPTSFLIPIFFLEIGSAPKEWSDTKLGEIASNAIMAATRSANTKGTNVVGFGGAHYSAKHSRIALEEDYQIGHIVSKYALEAGVSESTLKDTFSRTIGGCKTALVDWKGIRGDMKRRLVDQLTNWEIEVVRF